MKKSVVYLGVALVAFVNVSLASNGNMHSVIKNKIELSETITPLSVAIRKGDIEIVKKFVEYGADVNEISNGLRPLMIAARYNKTEIIKFLLSKGARINDKDENGFTALKYAQLSNANEAVQLLKESVSVN